MGVDAVGFGPANTWAVVGLSGVSVGLTACLGVDPGCGLVSVGWLTNAEPTLVNFIGFTYSGYV